MPDQHNRPWSGRLGGQPHQGWHRLTCPVDEERVFAHIGDRGTGGAEHLDWQLGHVFNLKEPGDDRQRSRYARTVVPDRDESEVLPRLGREVFDRPATDVAPELLGCILWHDSPVGLVAVRLVEVEAYRGAIDAASHAFRGRTARNAVMFGPPGHAYVYFSYGMHYCVNLVCEPAGRGEAVLIRAGAVVAGAQLAGHRRYGDAAGSIGSRGRQRELDLARGPGRLCQALGIDLSLDGADVCDPGGTLGISPPDAFDQPAAT
ncbi:MAG: DNA-3-methyladenine glycosylase, partial [Actinobacteria bacterium]|nr:DNA-3-methyladenine glycosylase [Actinomycetota bacterium]